MRPRLAFLTAMALLLPSVHALDVTSPEPVEIPREGGTLKAMLFRPEGQGPFPAVVGLHNCTGVTNRAGVMGSRYRDWGQRLAKEGFIVLLPDSYASRGLGSQCGVRASAIRVDRERVDDANAARLWLQSQPWVIPDRVSLMGWSTGAIAALWTVRAPRQAESKDFRSAVALYPGCRRLNNTAWSARVPTLILIGSADDQASAAVCQQMVAGARGRSARVAIYIYPNAYHDFDHPNRPLQVRSDLPFTLDGSGRAHTGTNPDARADALKRVKEWLAR